MEPIETLNETLTAASAHTLIDFATRFGINLLVIFIIVRLLYYPMRKNRDFLFTFFLFNIINFLICFLLSSAKLKMGFAFGLFAIFSILRYRTVTVPVREMGYFFISVTLGIINALTSNEQGMLLLVIANLIILGVAWIIDHKLRVVHENYKEVVYDRIDLIAPERREEMLADLKQRTGLPVHRVEFNRIDFFRDTARIYIFYNDHRNDSAVANSAQSDDD
ncbi:MAG: DUF4956 domain-containing protein [Bacteroidia bacterium]|jgi:hypothetical protein